MVSSVEMVLWAIHHATTLLFGVFASAALCGVEINRRHALELVLVGAVTGLPFRSPMPSAASFSPARYIRSSCICRSSSICARATA